jgi:sec-independent protein translocase protein TatB
MFEIGWTEILFVGIVAVLVLKPKDYPEMMRSIGQFLAKARTMAGEFQGQFNDALKEAKLDDVKKTFDELRDLKNIGPVQQVRDTFVKLADEATSIKTEVERAVAPPGANDPSTTSSTPAAGETPPPATLAADAPLNAGMPVIEPPPFPTAPPFDLRPPAAEHEPTPPPIPAAESNPGPTKAA